MQSSWHQLTVDEHSIGKYHIYKCFSCSNCISSNIYLAGGASLLTGLAERLETELSTLVAPSIHVQVSNILFCASMMCFQVHISPWRYHAAYLGAQILASSTQFDDTLINKESLNDFIQKLYAATF
jgi:actin-related protein